MIRTGKTLHWPNLWFAPSPMTKKWEDNFDALLTWLDPDREKAGERYEHIRQALINIFSWHGCADAEDLADETISRVTKKVLELAPNYKGDQALYFYGVAKKMQWEIGRRDQTTAKLPLLDNVKDSTRQPDSNDFELEYECLDQCLAQLPAADRDLIMLYYRQDQPKIDSRKELARKLDVAPNTLRVKVHRIRLMLHLCIEGCLQRKDRG
jgi:RNA polymerase sigma factor (sigma-70 family)